MKQKRFAGMANRAFRIVAACAVVMMLAGICSCGGKATAQGSAGSTAEEKAAEKQAKSELKELESQIKKALGVSPEELVAVKAMMDGKGDESLARVLAKYEVWTAAEEIEYLKSFDIGSWSASSLAKAKSYVADAKKKMSAVSEEKEKFVKEYKRIAEIKAMSVEELKKQPPAPESDFLVKPIDDSFTAVKVTKYKGSDPLVVIPATMQGLPVKEIGGEAFMVDTWSGNGDIVAVVTPEGMTYIGDGAFDSCPNLSVVVISEGVERIGGKVFKNCKNLSTVVLPSTLKAISSGYYEYSSEAFYGCSSLKSIELPAGLVYIGRLAFCESGLTSVKLPEGLMYIGERAFYGTPLTSVSLPKSLRLLGREAFGECGSLAEIQIPADHAISYHKDTDQGRFPSNKEYSFTEFFYGTKITESIALQKLLKETKTRKISWNEFESIRNDIAKKIGAKSLDSYGYIKW